MAKKKQYHADGELMEGRPSPIVLDNQTKSIDTIIVEGGGKKVTSGYDHTTYEAYAEYIKDLPDVDLQKECVKRGIFPKDNRRFNLEKLADVYAQQLKKLEIQNVRPIQVNGKLTAEQKRVLAQGSNKIVG
jgi:hypothetical protein